MGVAFAPVLGLTGRESRAADPGVTRKELLLGQTLSLDEGRNAFGVAVDAGVRLAVAAANAAGGVRGRTVRIEQLDDRGQPRIAKENAERLADAGVFAFFGPIEGGPSTAVAEVALARDIPLLGPMAGSPGLWSPPLRRVVFPVRAEHRAEFAALLRWGKETGLRRVAFLHSDSEVGRRHLANVNALAESLGMKVVFALPLGGPFSQSGIETAVQGIQAAGADMMLNHANTTEYPRLIKALNDRGLHLSYMAVNSGSTEMANKLGGDAHGIVFAQVMPSPWERKHAISREYQDALRASLPVGTELASRLSYGGLEGYTTARVVLSMLDAAGPEPTRSSLVRGIYSTSLTVGGMPLRYTPDAHLGLGFVDLSIVTRDGRFRQ